MPSVTRALPDLSAMNAFGKAIAERLTAGDVVALDGPLGAGKTTLARAILKALGHEGEVPSPTYTILERYDLNPLPIVHADFYRLTNPREVEELGLSEYREEAALLAEWPQRAGGFDEPARLSVQLEIAEEGRCAIVEGGRDWHGRMP